MPAACLSTLCGCSSPRQAWVSCSWSSSRIAFPVPGSKETHRFIGRDSGPSWTNPLTMATRCFLTPTKAAGQGIFFPSAQPNPDQSLPGFLHFSHSGKFPPEACRYSPSQGPAEYVFQAFCSLPPSRNPGLIPHLPGPAGTELSLQVSDRRPSHPYFTRRAAVPCREQPDWCSLPALLGQIKTKEPWGAQEGVTPWENGMSLFRRQKRLSISVPSGVHWVPSDHFRSPS